MLVLSRTTGGKFIIKIAGATLADGTVIKEDITITLVDVMRGRCKFGIEAQKEIPIYRSELIEQIYGEGK